MLLERDDALAAAAALVANAREGHGGALLVEGPPGSGRTALLDAAVAAAGGVTPLRARGGELETGLAFGVVRQLLGAAVLPLPEDERNALLDGAASLAAPVLGLGAGTDVADPLYGLYWLVAGLAERAPLLLAVDDLHWSDAESARFLAYLLPRLHELPIALLATAPDATAHAGFEAVRLPPLSRDAVARLLPGADPGEAHRLTGGSPMLVAELGRALAAAPPGTPLADLGSPTVARGVLDRVERVSPEAVALARAVALFPDGAEFDDAVAVADLAPDVAARAADGLVAARVFADGDRLAFLHPMMRGAVYADLGTFARRLGHQSAARRLKARHAPVEETAAHLLAGAPEGDAGNVAILRAAADEALRRVAPRAAVRYLERALAEGAGTGTRELLLRLGRLQRETGDATAGHATLARAVAESATPAERAEAAVEQAAAAFCTGDFAGVDEIARTTEATGDERLALDMLRAEAVWTTGDSRLCNELVDGVPEDLPGETSIQRFALVQRASVRFLRGAPIPEVVALLRRAVGRRGDDALVAGLDVGDPLGWLITCDALEEAQALADARLQVARATGNEHLYATTQYAVGWIAAMYGDLPRSAAEYRHGLAIGAAGPVHQRMMALNLAETMIYAGDVDEAELVLRELPGVDGTGFEASRRAEIAFWRGRPADALPAFEARARDEAAAGTVHPAVKIWVSDHVDCLLAVGRTDEAVALARDLAERSAETGGVLAHGWHTLTYGRATGDVATLRRAVEVLAPTPFRWYAARARLDLGSALRRAGERVEAREHLRAALDGFERCGAPSFADTAREELRLAGARPRRALIAGVEALTPGEGRIARLAAEGRSNKEIAQHLFLTVKTVEMTLVRAYRKLEIGSRAELAAMLRGAPA